MTWAKFDDRTPSNPKVALLSDAAFRLWFSAICHSCEHLTNGFIQTDLPGALPRAPAGKKLKDVTAELVKRGLWVPCEDGWQIHDFLQWNPTADVILKKREEARERMRLAREAKRPPKRPRSSSERSDDVRANEERSSHNPVPVPVPEDPPGNPPKGVDDDTPVLCPKDLLPATVVDELAGYLKLSHETIRQGEREFKSYWTIGKGQGRRHTRGVWLAKCRERIRTKAESGELADAKPTEEPTTKPTESPEAVEARFEALKRAKRMKLGMTG